eukprot:COSAG04_NODE_71_length_29147_cov_8.406018_18_plen_328_part_00
MLGGSSPPPVSETMETFLSSPLSLASVEALIADVPGGLPAIFAELDGGADARLAEDCLRRVFGAEFGADVLESADVASQLPAALQHRALAVRETLVRLLAGMAAAQPERLRRVLAESGALPLVAGLLADDSVGVAEDVQRLILALARGEGGGAAEFLPTLFTDGGLDALAAGASGIHRIRLASLLVTLGTAPDVGSGFRLCIESGRLDTVLGLASLAGGSGDVDLLELLSAFELLTQLGSMGAGLSYLAAEGVYAGLRGLATAEEGSMEAMLQPGALQFLADTTEAVRAPAPSPPQPARTTTHPPIRPPTHRMRHAIGHRGRRRVLR